MDAPRRPQLKGLRYIPLSYNQAEPRNSALRLVLTLFPEWESAKEEIELVRFTDGITNTLLKVIRRSPGRSEAEIDSDAVLLRAYGSSTELIIDRDRESASHSLLAQMGLAPPLLARFENGLLYRFIPGKVCSVANLSEKRIWRGVARRLAQWHAVLPLPEPQALPETVPEVVEEEEDALAVAAVVEKPRDATEDVLMSTLWSVMQRWINNLSTSTEAEKTRQAGLQKELDKLVTELGQPASAGGSKLVFAHCDLLHGNVIIDVGNAGADGVEKVNFIDYEYATPSPAAFDIANHFAEWGGFECDYSVLPTQNQRREFLTEYLTSYHDYLKDGSSPTEEEVETLFAQVDKYRGVPGFYWGIWALIQSTISQIDFDYAQYAEVRLGEYYAWRAQEAGTASEMTVREKRWAQVE